MNKVRIRRFISLMLTIIYMAVTVLPAQDVYAKTASKSSSSSSSSSKSSSSSSSSSKPSSSNQSSSKNNVSNKSSNYTPSSSSVKTGTYTSTSKTTSTSTSKTTSISTNTKSTTSNVKPASSNPFTSIANKVKSTVTNVSKSIASNVTKATSAVKSAVSTTAKTVQSVVSNVKTGINNVKTVIKNNTPSVLKSIASKAIATTSKAISNIKTAVKTVADNTKRAITSSPKTVAAAINTGTSKLKQVVSLAKDKVSTGLKVISSQVNKVVSNAKVAINNSVQKVKDVTTRVSTLFRNTASAISNGTNNLVKAASNGIKSAAVSLGQGVANAAGSIWNGAVKGFNATVKALDSRAGRAVLGTLQTVGGAIQIGVGASLCATGVGAIIGAPLMLHGAADVVQGAGNTFYAAINSKKTMPNFMEEAYKYAGRGIGGLIGGKEGAAMGEKIAGGVFFVADIGMGLVSGKAVLNVAKGAKGTSFINGTKKVLTSYGDEMLKGAKGVFKAVKEIPAAAKKVVKVVPEAFSAVSKKLVSSIDNLTKAKPKVTNVTNNKQLLKLDLQFFGGKADNATTGVSDVNKGLQEAKYQVGAYKDIKGVEGLDAHHVGQKAAKKNLVQNYDPMTAPAINVPKVGHTINGPNGIVSRSTKGITDARQLVARDLFELKRVYPDISNSTYKELIEMNKNMYPEMRK